MRVKKVVGYARISQEEQSNFSISGQVEYINNFCDKNAYEVVRMFLDEGQSAKSFDRKSWRELEKFLKEKHREIDYLVVFKYDRFSRNVQEALNVIHELENNYKIKILSVSEPIGLPPESPFYFQLRTTMLVNAHVERLIISDRTIFGQRRGRLEGRYLGLAPYGYRNARDVHKKPTLEIVPNEAAIIRDIFEQYQDGYTMAEILRQMQKRGFPKKGKTCIQEVLKNITYAGLVRVKAYQDEAEKIIVGIHEPIVDRDLFYAVQDKLNRPKPVKRHYNEIAYLKPAICCEECRRPLTAARSKGRRSYYWYYECPTHRKSFRMDHAHQKFNELLAELDFTEDQVEYLKETVKKGLQSHLKKNQDRLPELMKKKAALMAKKERLENKMLDSLVSDQDFFRLNEKLKTELKAMEEEINAANTTENAYWKHYFSRFENLKNISQIFHSGDVQMKQNFIKIGFGEKISYNGAIYRTAFLHPIFEPKTLIMSKKDLLKLHKKTGISEKPPLRVEAITITKHLNALLDWLDQAAA